MKVICIGGGPGGLYASLLLKRSHPTWDVTVHERNPTGDTFGFGVVFSGVTLAGLAEGDKKFHDDLLATAVQWDPIEVRLRDSSIRCHGQGFAAIGRHALLDLLRKEAERVGVVLRYESAVDTDALPEADIIIAADGARSAIRRRFAADLEPAIDTGATKFIWFGTTRAFECLTFLFEEGEHGPLAVHAYPFGGGKSTFIVETDEDTWRRAGLDRVSDDAPDDVASLAYCEKVFARWLDGHPLISNRSRWMNFRTVRAQRWYAGNVVLLGDAAHTAHFSVGSGTKMALEDALALDRALANETNIEKAFALYEADRRPRVRKVQMSSLPSLFWWEHFGLAMRRPIEPFAFRFLTRNYRVSKESLVKRDPAFVSRIEEWFAETTKSKKGAAASARYALRGVELAGRLVREPHVAVAGDANAALVLERIGDGSSAVASGAKRGIVARPDELAQADRVLAGADWLDVVLSEGADPAAVVREVRRGWQKPLSARLTVAKHGHAAATERAVAALASGADMITFDPAPGAEDYAYLAADALRYQNEAPVMLACPPSLVETLLISERCDLCLLRPAPEPGERRST